MRYLIFGMCFAACIASCAPRTDTQGSDIARAKRKASQAIASGNYDRAIAILTPLLAQAPRDPDVHSMLGESQWKTGDVEEAQARFEAALRLDYTDYRTHMRLAQMLAGQGRTGRALTEFELAVRYGGNDPLTHYNYGLALYRMKKTDEAVIEWQFAYDLESDNPKYAAALGMGFSGKDDKAALQYFEKARVLGEDSPDFHNNFGILLDRLGEFERAATHFREARRRDPDNLQYARNLAALYMKTRSYAEACPLWEMLLEREPGTLSDVVYLAKAYVELEMYLKAIASLEAAMDDLEREHTKRSRRRSGGGTRALPAMHQVYELLAVSYRGIGELEPAFEFMQRAVDAAPDNATYLNTYGVILAERGMIAEAVTQWKKVLQLEPDNAAARKYLSAYRQR